MEKSMKEMIKITEMETDEEEGGFTFKAMAAFKKEQCRGL